MDRLEKNLLNRQRSYLEKQGEKTCVRFWQIYYGWRSKPSFKDLGCNRDMLKTNNK